LYISDGDRCCWTTPHCKYLLQHSPLATNTVQHLYSVHTIHILDSKKFEKVATKKIDQDTEVYLRSLLYVYIPD
jgi:hypothetical protein